MFSNIVVARTSYIFKEVIVGAKFKPMFERYEAGNKTILYLDRLNSYTTAEIKFVDNVAI